LESLGVSHSRGDWLGPGGWGGWQGRAQEVAGKAIAAVGAGPVTPLTGDRHVGANAARRWRSGHQPSRRCFVLPILAAVYADRSNSLLGSGLVAASRGGDSGPLSQIQRGQNTRRGPLSGRSELVDEVTERRGVQI
jgi:hypothetical protein